MATVLLLALPFIVLYIAQKYSEFRRALASVSNFPGRHSVFFSTSVINNFLPKVKYVTFGGNQLFYLNFNFILCLFSTVAYHMIESYVSGRNQLFVNKHQPFKDCGWDVHSAISLLPKTKVTIVVADAAVAKEITSSRVRFPKPIQHYRSLCFFGRNIVVSEGEEWKKFRKISAPAFSERNNVLVWNESIRAVKSMFEEVWNGRDIITVDHCVDITVPLALFVVGAAEFGRSISWKEDAVIPPGFTMPFKDALHIVAKDAFLKVVVPDRAMGWTERLRTCRQAFAELRRYLANMIQERQKAELNERHDLFSSLLAANDQNIESTGALSESDLIGNIYIFLLAGHETSAHTLCFAFALLALYPDEQERLFEQIKFVLAGGQDLAYEHISLLTYSNAVLFETLRMFPPVTNIPKLSLEDTIVVTRNSQGESATVPLPTGAEIVLNVPGLHYNPHYWEDPHTFKPARFLQEDWPRDAFIPFSSGPRSCIGRRFFETEGIAILSMLVSHYKISVKEEPEFAHETFEERKARVLACRAGVTMTPLRVPLTFTRRA